MNQSNKPDYQEDEDDPERYFSDKTIEEVLYVFRGEGVDKMI